MSRGVRYRVIRKLAHGGMAEIFLANQIGAEGFQKPVVLKRILPALAQDPAFVRMLLDEAHIVSGLNHSNLVQVLDLGKAGDQFFLVLEFVDGFSLEQIRRRARKLRMKLPLPLVLHVVSSLCRALDYVHRRTVNGKPQGIVHRDVTPQNVLVSREGEVKLADFGIAKAVGKREKSATGVIKGKFAYMSPEQALGGELDARSDLFSVGTLLYVLTTGKKPFEAATDLETLMAVRRARFEKPSSFVRDYNPDVERFLNRALRSERSKRFQSAEQMADRLDKILVKLGQPTGPAALKRWLDTLTARDGILPPGDIKETSLDRPSGTVQLSSDDLELQGIEPAPVTLGEELDIELSPSPAAAASPSARPAPATVIDKPRAPSELPTWVVDAAELEPVTAQTEACAVGEGASPPAEAAPATSPADPEDPEANPPITIVVPSGATVVGLSPDAEDVRLRHEGLAQSSARAENAEPDTTQVTSPESLVGGQESSGELGLEVHVVSTVSSVDGRVAEHGSQGDVRAEPWAPSSTGSTLSGGALRLADGVAGLPATPLSAGAIAVERVPAAFSAPGGVSAFARGVRRTLLTAALSLLVLAALLLSVRALLPPELLPSPWDERLQHWLGSANGPPSAKPPA